MSSANPTYKPSEGKREEFRKYLEKNGVMDALTKVLVNLYEEVEKPEDALEYIRDKLATLAGLETHKQLTAKLQQAEERVKELEDQELTMKRGSVGETPADGSEENTGMEFPTEEPLEAPPEEPIKEEPVEEQQPPPPAEEE